ncbi:hypothetical protein ACOSQ4_026150 [Xanthoceras sorbifolium]
MSHRNESDDDGDGFSGSESDDAFDEDMEALRRACMITGTDPNDLDNANRPSSPATAAANSTAAVAAEDSVAFSSDSEDDLELVRNIQNRLALSNPNDVCEPLSLEALCTLPPAVSDEDEDDFEILRVIQRRFSNYNMTDTTKNNTGDLLQTPKQVHASIVESANDTSNNLFVNRVNASQGLPESEEACKNIHLLGNSAERQPSGSNEGRQSDACRLPILPHIRSNFPTSAQLFVDAIKKNRSYQKFIRSKLTQIEARLEENKKLKERVKILKDFQVSCRKITGRALSQKKDPRVQLISAQKSRTSKDAEVNDKKPSAMHYGPAENSHVANYRTAFTKYPLSLQRKKWSKTEKENLGKGLRQQFQEMMLQVSMDRLSCPEECRDIISVDNIFASVKDIDVTPAMIREFLPKVDWNQLASMFIEGRSGAECETQWLNFEDPLINHNPWTTEEDKSLLFIIQAKGISDWNDIAVSLGTNRTPFQCLARYQRSLNACILKREWTADEDEQLRIAVEAFGESNWQAVASTLKGRTGPQCSNRWKKTLNPMRLRVGRWTPDEDKRLTVATMLFGPKNWKKIAQFVPGRTQVQCRERWVNSLDPSVNRGEWTEEEDLRLEAAIEEHGYCWSKVAAFLSSRTDNQCWRRWKALHPHEVPLLQEARKMQRIALISNFVDRERERPTLGPKDFIATPMITFTSEPENGKLSRKHKRTENVKSSRKRKRNAREKPESRKEEEAASGYIQTRSKSRRARKMTQLCSEEVSGITGLDGKKTLKPYTGKRKVNGVPDTAKKVSKRCSKKQNCVDPNESCQSIVLLPSESLGTEITCGDGSNTLGGNDNDAMSDPLCSSEKYLLSGTVNGAELMHDHLGYLDSSFLTNGREVDVLGGKNLSRKKLTPRRTSKNKSYVELGKEDHGLTFPPETQWIADDEGRNFSLEGSNSALKQNRRRKKCSEPLEECRSVGHVPCQQDGRNTSKPSRKHNSKHLLQVADEDDITLACFLRNKSTSLSETQRIANDEGCFSLEGSNEPLGDCRSVEHFPCQQDGCNTSKPRRRSNSKHLLQVADEDDITLACFLRNKSKKRRVEAAENTENFPCQEDGCNTSKPRRRSNSKHLLQVADEDNITLTCFLRNKSKKRRVEAAENTEKACSLSGKNNMESSLLSKALDQHNNENLLLHTHEDEAQTSCNDGTPENI